VPGIVLSSVGCRAGQPATQELEVQSADVTLRVYVAGNAKSGNVLIAIHGGPGMASDYMVSLEQLAGSGLAVVRYDQRGTGRSTSPPNEGASYGFDDYVNDLEAVRKRIDAAKVHLLGHSWGGVLAMRYATAHPQSVRSIILMGSGAPSITAARSAQANKMQRIVALQQQGLMPEQIGSLQDILPSYFADPEFKMPSELADLYYNPAVEQLTWSALGDYDFTKDVARLDHPVLVLWGQDDPFGVQMAEAAVSALSNARTQFVTLEACGHFWHECPTPFFSHVEAFLKRVGAE
jgi:proline iminopeptidase